MHVKIHMSLELNEILLVLQVQIFWQTQHLNQRCITCSSIWSDSTIANQYACEFYHTMLPIDDAIISISYQEFPTMVGRLVSVIMTALEI